MKKFFKTIVFQIGVDVLGFPVFHEHKIEQESYHSNPAFFKEPSRYRGSVYFKPYSKK